MAETLDPLRGAHPLLAEKIPQIIEYVRKKGHVMKVIEGLRSTDRQKTLYAQGRTTPGKIVTYCDGVKNKSKHQIQSDGYFHAVDLVFVVKGRVTWDGPWQILGEAVHIIGGLVWGGDWTPKKMDRPHIEV